MEAQQIGVAETAVDPDRWLEENMVNRQGLKNNIRKTGSIIVAKMEFYINQPNKLLQKLKNNGEGRVGEN